MRKKGRIKYVFVIFLLSFILIYGFIQVNINKPELVRNQSKFTINLITKPFDFRIEGKDYVFYVNGKIIDDMKDKCINTYNELILK